LVVVEIAGEARGWWSIEEAVQEERIKQTI
jgi:hypothetical protein